MKTIKIILFATVGYLLNSSALAAHLPTSWFTTIDQAQQYCPTGSQIEFVTSGFPSLRSGMLVGNQNKRLFTSPGNTLQPQEGASINLYQKQVRQAYGYEKGRVIECFYSYTNFAGSTSKVELRSTKYLG
ncbi:MAG: hypothetical protein K5Q00_07855 [Gammaproteobacteria bacterium]|nr:hypothetical protein [Gammaproteobacteria bacterium]